MSGKRKRDDRQRVLEEYGIEKPKFIKKKRAPKRKYTQKKLDNYFVRLTGGALPKGKGMPELSNVQIDEYFHSNPDYAGCFAKDELPMDMGNKFAILNMQNSRDGGGTHWVLLYNVDPKQVVYFDSMGEVPPVKIKQFMNRTGKKQVVNKLQLQPLKSSSCGWWDIAAAVAFEKGQSLSQFVSHFSQHDIEGNDSDLHRLFF
jgi:hypothetical protein